MKFAFLTLAAALGCALLPHTAAGQQDKPTTPFYSPKHFQTKEWKASAARFEKKALLLRPLLTRAKRVEVFRLFPLKDEQPKGNLLGDFPYYAKEQDQSVAFAKRLADLVLDPKSCFFPDVTSKMCLLDPGVGFRFSHGKQYTDIVLCLKCRILAVYKSDYKLTKEDKGRGRSPYNIVMADFDPAFASFLELAKQALPNNPEIQKLR